MKIPFKSKLAKIGDIKVRNKKFKNLTPAEKRQEIAFDALNLVLIGKMIASYGSYWGNTLCDLQVDVIEERKDAEYFQEKLNKDLPPCDVCQRGLMMVSAIRLGNAVSPNDDDVHKGSSNLLEGKGFSMEDFEKMEIEFEGYSGKSVLPYENNTEEKLANICCNIIANGNFNLEDKTDYLKKWNLEITRI